MIPPILTTEIRSEHDVVLARQRARQLASLLGLAPQDQTRIATAVSEIARNAFQYAGGGKVVFELGAAPPRLQISVRDRGPGIARLADVLDGRYRSPTGLGLGILGARRLSDRFTVRSTPGEGTVVVLEKLIEGPVSAAVAASDVSRLSRELALLAPHDPLTEIREQNQEMLRALDELRERQTEIERLNQELAETNRGVLALYAELDEKAADLARASELKSRFLSNISHELRTPLNAILNITRLLIERMDGPLTEEQDRQVRFVRDAASTLSEMVNDLLDLARIEAGRSVVRPTTFTAVDLFSALRGMFRALAPSDRVTLVLDEPVDVPPLTTDEGKLSQILRNFIANALKFTERGEVRVSAALADDDKVVFAVADTGIGIAPEDQERIFEEFSQLESALQRKATGAGLGLPLSRKLAELLGGGVALTSTPGVGSTFRVTIPAVYVPTGRPSGQGLHAIEVEHA
ncbi:MAG TPA: ATP-binding protein [Gemmatimonadales bacterium]|nr:ATP-binding protein [Gemmatimonadales bacterium]